MEHPSVHIERIYIEHLSLAGRPAPGMHWCVGPTMPCEPQETPMPLTVRCTTEEKVRISVQPKTRSGKDATFDGPVVWTVLSGTAIVTPIDDTSVWVQPGPDILDSVISAEGDADLDAGIETIQDLLTLQPEHPRAASMGLTADEPVLQDS